MCIVITTYHLILIQLMENRLSSTPNVHKYIFAYIVSCCICKVEEHLEFQIRCFCVDKRTRRYLKTKFAKSFPNSSKTCSLKTEENIRYCMNINLIGSIITIHHWMILSINLQSLIILCTITIDYSVLEVYYTVLHLSTMLHVSHINVKGITVQSSTITTITVESFFW